MDLAMTRDGRALVIAVSGRLDSNTSPDVERQLLERIQAGEVNIVMDFSALDYISSAGLRVLMVAAKRVKAGKGGVALCALNSNIRDVLQMSGFHQIFRIHDSVADALVER